MIIQIYPLIERKEIIMYITIAGELGSGKSTIAKLIHEKYGFMLYSTGSIQREIAREHGISTLELNLQMTNDINNEYDKLIDNKTIEIAQTNRHKDVIFDSRMAWHFVERSFKVYIVVDNYIAAQRVIASNRGNEEHYDDINGAMRALSKRKLIENVRFLQMYHVNNLDYNNYDLIVDSSYISPEQLAEFIINKAHNHAGKLAYLSPKRLFPTQSLRNINPLFVKELQESGQLDEGISVVLYNEYYYIIDGHHRACANIQNGNPLVKVNILNIGADGIVENYDLPFCDLVQINRTNYYDWEDYNSLRFNSYPTLNECEM